MLEFVYGTSNFVSSLLMLIAFDIFLLTRFESFKRTRWHAALWGNIGLAVLMAVWTTGVGSHAASVQGFANLFDWEDAKTQQVDAKVYYARIEQTREQEANAE